MVPSCKKESNKTKEPNLARIPRKLKKKNEIQTGAISNFNNLNMLTEFISLNLK